VMAAGSMPYDIGDGNFGTGGTLAISGNAAVFLRNNSCIEPTAATHTHVNVTGFTGSSCYGLPISWKGDFGAYLRIYTLSYNANGGSGKIASATQHTGTSCKVSNGSGLTMPGFSLVKWTTAANGGGTSYALGSTFTFNANTTLFAQWKMGIPTLSAASAGYNSVKLTWNAIAAVKGYELCRATSSGGQYTRVKALAGTSFTDTSLIPGKTYYYKVRAYKIVGTKTIYGDYSGIKSAKPVPAVPLNVKAARVSSSKIKITWGEVSGATKYEVHRASSLTGKYSLVCTTSAKKFTNTRLTKGKTYYYKVRALYQKGSTKAYGNYSAVVKAKP
jgi:hypothetical protein